MSHWTTVKTEFKDLQCLKKAGKQLGCGVLHNAEARGYYKNMRTKGELVFSHPGSPYDVAVKKAGKKLELVADMFGGHIERIYGKNYSKLKQRYAVEVVKKKARLLGALVTEEKGQDGTIKLKVRGV